MDPTAEFTLLPLYAAGLYEKRNQNLSHLYISCYTPTLMTLIRTRQQMHPRNVLLHRPSKTRRRVASELAVISQRLAPVVSFTSPESPGVTNLECEIRLTGYHIGRTEICTLYFFLQSSMAKEFESVCECIVAWAPNLKWLCGFEDHRANLEAGQGNCPNIR